MCPGVPVGVAEGPDDMDQALALPAHQVLTYGVLALPGKPSSDIHAVHGDARQDLGCEVSRRNRMPFRM